MRVVEDDQSLGVDEIFKLLSNGVRRGWTPDLAVAVGVSQEEEA